MEREIVRNEERFAGQARDRNRGHHWSHRQPDADDFGLAMLQHGDETVVRRRLMIRVQPMVKRWTSAGQGGHEQQQHQGAGEDRFAERAQSRGCSFGDHVSELNRQTFSAASLFPADLARRGQHPRRGNPQRAFT